jgi:hypothetical protein
MGPDPIRGTIGCTRQARVGGLAPRTGTSYRYRVAWQCPECGRSFGRRGQWHSCTPAPTVEHWLSTRPPKVLGIVDAVIGHVAGRGDDVVLEPTRDAVMVKKARTFAEVKPRQNTTEVAFIVSRRIDDPRVLRTLDLTSRRIVHVVAVSDAAEVDQQLREWLTEAYRSSAS